MILSDVEFQQHARDTAMGLDGVTSGYSFTPNLQVFKVHGKVFLLVTENNSALPLITVKADPLDGDRLRRDYASAAPGRYFNKRPWVSLATGTGVDQGLIEDLVRDSYDLANERRKRT